MRRTLRDARDARDAKIRLGSLVWGDVPPPGFCSKLVVFIIFFSKNKIERNRP